MVPRWWPHKISSRSPKTKKGETFLFAAGVVLVIGAAIALNNYESRMTDRLENISAQANLVAVHPDNEPEEDSADKSNNDKKTKNSSSGDPTSQPSSTTPAPSSSPIPTNAPALTGSRQNTRPSQPSSPPSSQPPNEQPGGLGGLIDDLLCLPIICS